MVECPRCAAIRDSLHRHHIVPKSMGGTDAASNIALVCANCHEDLHYGPYGGPKLARRGAHTKEANAKRAESMRKAWADGRFKDRPKPTAEQTAKRLEAARIGARRRTPEDRAEAGRKIGETRRKTEAAKNRKRNQRIAELHEAGVTQKAIGELVGCSTNTVNYTLTLQREGKI